MFSPIWSEHEGVSLRTKREFVEIDRLLGHVKLSFLVRSLAMYMQPIFLIGGV